ncbi:MAG: hypothetical protein ACE5KO_02570, partial [Candidatus Bathyarchaeia archaeon]
MVFLRKLELTSFKTFGKKTVLTLCDGFNVVMGPNGSGKTNIVDAVQFVLGELSVRNLRATNFSALLFSGNNDIAKASRAGVSLHLDNTDRRLPIETDVVTVSRYISTDGTSSYRINGRRYSRGDLIDVLGVAALTGGMNIVFQGTAMRIADYSPEDRRRNIEGLIGISEYDKKKQEAQIELREAETNLRVAAGRHEEVRKRFLELERERNDLLRYNYLNSELNRLNALKTSQRIQELRATVSRLGRETGEKSDHLSTAKKERESVEERRVALQKEWRVYAEKVLDKGQNQMFQLEKQIGDLNSDMAGHRSTQVSFRNTLQSYETMQESKITSMTDIRNEIIASRKELKKLQRSDDSIQSVLDENQKRRKELLTKIDNIKSSAEENATQYKNLDQQLSKLESEQAKQTVTARSVEETHDIVAEQLSILESKKPEFEQLFSSQETRLKEIHSLSGRERQRFEGFVQRIDRTKMQRDSSERDVKGAERVVRQARMSITEFESQRQFADSVLSEEKALEHIENLADIGAIKGVLGRLNERIKIKNHKTAVEAAAEGWLNALVADNIEVVRKCADNLRRSKIGRVKLIPLANLRNTPPLDKPKVSGLLGSAGSFVDSANKYRSAVNFVLGDTFVASSEEAALAASYEGYRAVTVDGEVYEPGVKLKVGFYREPIDLSEALPSDKAIKQIGETITAFENLLDKRSQEVKKLADELIKLEGEKTYQSDTMRFFDYEANLLQRNVDRLHKDIVELNRRLRSFQHKKESYRAAIEEANQRVKVVTGEAHKIRIEMATYKKRMKPELVTQLEGQNAQMEAEINDLSRQLSNISGKKATLEANIRDIQVPAFTTAREELSGIRRNISKFKRTIEDAGEAVDGTSAQIKQVKKSREELASKLTASKEDSRKFTDSLEELDQQARAIDKQLEPIGDGLQNLRQEMLRNQLELERHIDELKRTGQTEQQSFEELDFNVVNSTIDQLSEEFKTLSVRVNMNALTFYDEAKKNFKELSIRMNELEQEKTEILRFMDT